MSAAVQYAAAARAWAEAIRKDSTHANELFDHLRALGRRLRQTPTGRNSLISFLEDGDPAIRLWAAFDVLSFAEDKAIPVLEALRVSPGLEAVSAKWTLRQFLKGKLEID